jgi:1-acyl-sn-glycerol-3-phosphate acyltransferase
LSQTETEVSPISKKKETEAEPLPMPEWGIETVRFVGRSLSRLFFGIKYRNPENIPQALPGGLLVCANHQSFFDPFWICFPIRRRIRYMTWDAATRWFIVGDFIRALGAFPVNIERGSKGALKMSLGWLRSGGTLVVFPEGARSLSDGKMLEFKNGAVRIAMDAGVPILPVTVIGGNRVWAQDMKYPKLARVEIVYHPVLELPPVPEGGDPRAHINELTAKLAEIIGSALPSNN